MGKFLAVIAIAASAWFYTGGKLPGNDIAKAVDVSGNPVVLVFTVDGCKKPCKSAMKQLKKRDVPFKEVKVNLANPKDKNTQLWEKMGKRGFPYIASGSERVIGNSKAQIASLLGVNYGNSYLTKSEKKYYSKHFYADGKPKIIIYGASWCGYCKKLREELEADNTDYIEIDVEKRKDHKKLSRVMGISGYPSTWVGYSRVDGTTLRAVKATMDKS